MTELVPLPRQPDGVAWPTGRWPTSAPEVDDRGHLASLVEELFDPPGPVERGHTHALLVVQGGRLVIERYGYRFVSELEELSGVTPEPITADTRHISWSMAKSILHAAVGVLVGDGRIDVADRAPVPAWSDPADPRRRITWDDLLTMRPGLAWVEEYYEFDGSRLPDVVSMLFGEGNADMAGFAARFPLVHEPGSAAAYTYSSGTSNILAACVGQVIGGGEARMRRFLAERVFGPIGMASAEPSFDAAGTFVASSYVHATAQDFARFGLLYLRDGNWDGHQVLPAGWVDHGRLPRSPDEGSFHGAHWWARADGTFFADGFEGQRILVVPALDLVLVRLGKTHVDHAPALDARLDEIIHCFARLRAKP